MSNVLLQNDLEEVREAFAINDLQGATWAFRKLRAIEEKQKEITAIAIEEKLRIDAVSYTHLDVYKRQQLIQVS